jgi:Zn-finger nucleic acid-binding protein
MAECDYCEGHGKVDKNGNPPGSPSLQGDMRLCPQCRGVGNLEKEHSCQALEKIKKLPSSNVDFISIDDDGNFRLWNGDDNYYAPIILYCPFCGIKLLRRRAKES